MFRAIVAAAFSLLAAAAAAQEPGVLHVRVVLTDAAQTPTPVARHTLLISDNPTTAPPRVIVTRNDGTGEIRLPPGNYTVESDRPVVFEGKAFEWTQMVDVAAGRDTVLELTSANVEVAPDAAAAPASGREPDLARLARWQEGVVALWTPTTHASGFLVDAGGLVATSQRAVSTAATVEVQISPTVKVAGRVIVADAARDVAVIRIAPAAAAPLRPIPPGCLQPAVINRTGLELVAIGAPLRQPKGPAFGTVDRVDAHTITTDFILPTGSAGGPVFTAEGTLVGMTSEDAEKADERRQNSRVVSVADVCEVVRSAQHKVREAGTPDDTRLPVESPTTVPEAVLKEAAQGRIRSLTTYQLSSSDFDVTFVTPVMVYAARSHDRGTAGPPRLDPSFVVTDFGNWSDYVGDIPPVLLVRVTPKLVESFWGKLARGAALTQGARLPPLKHLKAGFSRLQAFCGDDEVVPIHALAIEHRLSPSGAVTEGLYAFDPGALGPSCPAVTVVVHSGTAPTRSETRVVDPKIIEQVWADFAPYRAWTQRPDAP